MFGSLQFGIMYFAGVVEYAVIPPIPPEPPAPPPFVAICNPRVTVGTASAQSRVAASGFANPSGNPGALGSASCRGGVRSVGTSGGCPS